MPKKLDACVSRLVGNTKFRPRRNGQTKEQAAYAVCQNALGVNASDEFSDNDKSELDLIEKFATLGEDALYTFSNVTVEEGSPPEVFEILRSGTWDHPWYGEFTISKETLEDFVASFEARLVAKGPNYEDNELPINLDHQRGGPAAGWIHKLSIREDDGQFVLDVHAKWTELGVEQLTKKLYKYVSAELGFKHEDSETRIIDTNVLTGAGLTNIPYFKGLMPLTMSDKTAFMVGVPEKFSDKKLPKEEKKMPVKLKELLAKKASELNASEIEALKTAFSEDKLSAKDALKFSEHLTEKKSSKKEDKPTDNKFVQIDPVEFEALKKTANRVTELEAKAKETEDKAFVDGLMYSESNKKGKFVPASREALEKFTASLNKDQREAFTAVVEAMPKLDLFEEKGSGETSEQFNDVALKVDALVKEEMSKDSKLKYSDALSIVRNNNPELVQQYIEG